MNPATIIAGKLHRDFILPASGQPQIDVPGGDLLYTASGSLIWQGEYGLLARAGEDYPRRWLDQLQQLGVDTTGITILPEAIDLRNFMVYTADLECHQTNPLAHFARLSLTLPKLLLGYQPPVPDPEVITHVQASSVRPTDIPPDYLDARLVHLCALEYATQVRLISAFREAGTGTVTLDPLGEYMQSEHWVKVNQLINGLTAFLPSEEDVRALFRGQSTDLVEMAQALASNNCELVVVKRGAQGQLLHDGVSHKTWQVPAYPVQVADPTGVGASFCGGFLAGYHRTYDPLQAVLQGNISASLKLEGSGVFHILESHPGLAQRRLEGLKESVRQL